MDRSRLEAFSDGVIAILITIMVLELRPPAGQTWAALHDIASELLMYLMSFVFLGIYWNNHHHMFQLTARVNGAILWANLHLLFWLSLVPFVTEWMARNHAAPVPTAAYGIVLVCAAVAYTILQNRIIDEHGPECALAKAVGRDAKGKISMLCYLAAIGLAFVAPWIADALYIVVALMWLVPDRRIEERLRPDA